jgi:hypothetical protein
MVYWHPVVVHIISIQIIVVTHNSYVSSSKIYIHSNIKLFYMFQAYMPIIRNHRLNYITILYCNKQYCDIIQMVIPDNVYISP